MADSKKAKILVVDDEANIVKALKYMLEAEGYAVETAADGEEALNMVKTSEPDLVLLDVMMPKKSGYEVCKAIKEDKALYMIPVVMLTALKQKEERIKAIEAGADDFLSKPVDDRELFVRVKSLLRIKFLNYELKENYYKLKGLEIFKENLTNMIVHDMKNTLQTSVGYLSIIARGINKPNEKHKEFIEIVQASNNNILRMVLNLLDISIIEENKYIYNYEQIDLTEIIVQTIKTLESLAKQSKMTVVSTVNLSAQTTVYADKTLVERIVMNLISNAIQYSTSGSEIVVSARREDDNHCVEVCIASEGQHIPKEYHGKIFDKYGQLEINVEYKSLRKGMGLNFCKLAVEANKGRIWVESELSGHNRFYFTLPMEQQPKADAQ
jgi:DNA-binding response OmpR family regulator